MFGLYGDKSANKPPNTWGAFLHIENAQLAFGGLNGSVYVRRNGGSAWTEWEKV